ncbi:antimicrobial peptide NK-lysin [Pempheris klunzingeri]|uniref:antimicrobial peptide NK-lysin n=1 Tax=Pempheris klunzingeri TaxID=3127111 RepID=UPI00397FD32E
MSPAITIALLLLSTTVVKSLEDQNKEEDFPPQLKHDVRERADRHIEGVLQGGSLPGACCVCKNIVSKIKQKMGSDHSKKKIRQLLTNFCNRLKVFKLICKRTNFINKMIDAIANSGSPHSICVKLKLCK